VGVDEVEELFADLAVCAGVAYAALLGVAKDSLYPDAAGDLTLEVATLTRVDQRHYRSLERRISSSLDTARGEGEKRAKSTAYKILPLHSIVLNFVYARHYLPLLCEGERGT
jgi:hypothetical protein